MTLIVTAGVIALLSVLVGTRIFIKFLVKRGYGQFIRDDGPTTHKTKRGTPTMGGAVIVLSVVFAYLLSHLIFWQPITVSGALMMFLLVATAILGFIDDWTKITKQRSLGLTSRGKLIGQTLIGVTFGYLALQFPNALGFTPASTAISFTRDIEWLKLPLVLAVIWITLLILASSNAVNLTDGLDGLATGALTMVFGAFALINIWQRNQRCAGSAMDKTMCYPARDPWDLAIISVALAAGCFGFLWWNAKPAKIFMGDTGSLSLGAALGGMAVMTRTELLLILLGALFVIETASVIIQVSYFKLSKGKRVFKMTPLHHHFELLGWDEATVVIRFWIICGVSVGLALSLFYGGWILGV